ncbi:phage tail protein [Portibacter lacus]|uniref:Phage tail protein n=1 Tax=Portibacter lacus TaxID=1099794 RepID=A0AA37SMY6_9BACT|nr:phage tail protein [Portibacter lacus]GLR16705.1 hypothetical protein GCM10007940_13200 [Portibacter lacus]
MAADKFPVPKFHFNVDLGSGNISFQEVTGLDQEFEHLEYRSGDDAEYVTQKRIGLKKTGTLSFKKGIFSGETDVLDIYEPGNNKEKYYSNQDPLDLVISLMDEAGTAVLEWAVRGAVPVKITNGDLKSDENAIAIEQIDFVHSGITLTHN